MDVEKEVDDDNGWDDTVEVGFKVLSWFNKSKAFGAEGDASTIL